MNRRLHIRTILISVGILILLSAYTTLARRSTIQFFSDTLQETLVTSTVVVNGSTYEVHDGEVYFADKVIMGQQSLRPLQIAYAHTSAQRNPLLGIAGVDPTLLEASIATLNEMTMELASAQTEESESSLIRTALYPIAYLHSLATLEKARDVFIRTGSDTDYKLYNAALAATVKQGITDLYAFSNALRSQVGTSSASLSLPGGKVRLSALVDWVEATVDSFSSIQHQVIRRSKCVSGTYSQCNPADLLTPIPDSLIHLDANNNLQTAREIAAFRAKVVTTPLTQEARQIVILNKSACVSVAQPPYVFQLGTAQHQPAFIGELFFNSVKRSDTKRTLNTLDYLIDTIGIKYVVTNPTIFYQCPDALTDLGRIKATLDTTSFARAHPALIPDFRSSLLQHSDVVYESDAHAYVRALLNSPTPLLSLPDTVQNSVYELALEFYEQRAGLDIIVQKIASVIDQDLRLKANGVPFDTSVKTWFLTHSAAPSLFSVGLDFGQYKTHEPDDYLKNYVPYSQLIQSVPRNTLIDSYRKFILLETSQ